MASVAVISGKGGTGKTTTALTIASAWAEQGDTYLLDLDNDSDAESATWWLDRVEDPPESLTWVKTKPGSVVDLVGRLDVPLVVDTEAKLKEVRPEVLAAVDGVVVVGSSDELASILQAILTAQSMADTPVAVVLTRTATATLRGAWGQSVSTSIEAHDVKVLGCIRHYSELARAGMRGVTPSQITRPEVRADAAAVIAALDKFLKKTGR